MAQPNYGDISPITAEMWGKSMAQAVNDQMTRAM
jgi:hypothetical protein